MKKTTIITVTFAIVGVIITSMLSLLIAKHYINAVEKGIAKANEYYNNLNLTEKEMIEMRTRCTLPTDAEVLEFDYIENYKYSFAAKVSISADDADVLRQMFISDSEYYDLQRDAPVTSESVEWWNIDTAKETLYAYGIDWIAPYNPKEAYFTNMFFIEDNSDEIYLYINSVCN